ncbi:MAG: hypothetical protein CMN30_03615 [Sandaracinus sp.]|nr:hypothetical protein [Sandaracinus sp.]
MGDPRALQWVGDSLQVLGRRTDGVFLATRVDPATGAPEATFGEGGPLTLPDVFSRASVFLATTTHVVFGGYEVLAADDWAWRIQSRTVDGAVAWDEMDDLTNPTTFEAGLDQVTGLALYGDQLLALGIADGSRDQIDGQLRDPATGAVTSEWTNLAPSVQAVTAVDGAALYFGGSYEVRLGAGGRGWAIERVAAPE